MWGGGGVLLTFDQLRAGGRPVGAVAVEDAGAHVDEPVSAQVQSERGDVPQVPQQVIRQLGDRRVGQLQHQLVVAQETLHRSHTVRIGTGIPAESARPKHGHNWSWKHGMQR